MGAVSRTTWFFFGLFVAGATGCAALLTQSGLPQNVADIHQWLKPPHIFQVITAIGAAIGALAGGFQLLGPSPVTSGDLTRSKQEILKHQSRLAAEQVQAIAQVIDERLGAILASLARSQTADAPAADERSRRALVVAAREIANSPESALQEAAKLLAKGRIFDGLAVLREDAKAAGQAAAARWRRLGALAFSVDVAESRSAYLEAFKLDPLHIETCVFLIRLDIAAGDIQAAEEHALHAVSVAKRPDDLAQALIKLGDVLVRQGRTDLARSRFLESYAITSAGYPESAEFGETLSAQYVATERSIHSSE